MPVEKMHSYYGTRRVLLGRVKQHPRIVFAGAVLLGCLVLLSLNTVVRSYEQNLRYGAFLDALQSDYRQHVWNTYTGRTIDAQNGGVTTSESQGYSMLRAVWLNDRGGFDATWQWTAAHLQRSDKLFSWRYSEKPSGDASLLPFENTASDADTDIAYALLLAGARWHDGRYTSAAQQIVRSIWSGEVVSVHGQPYLAADNLEKNASTATIVVNPSYIAPYAYRAFARIDQDYPWLTLVSSSYHFLQAASVAPLDTSGSAGLPPDWLLVDRRTGSLQAATDAGHTTDFGYNALRTLWRVGLDYRWYHDPEAQATLHHFDLLQREWRMHHRLYAIYAHDGTPKTSYASLALYGAALGYFSAIDESTAPTVFMDTMQPLLDRQSKQMAHAASYYDNNWLWFGVALLRGQLRDFTMGGRS